MNSQFIVHKDLVHLKHLDSQRYLGDTEISYKNGYLVGGQKEKSKCTIWIIEKFCPAYPGFKPNQYGNTEIWPGDMITIKSLVSGNLLTSYSGNKSLVTKQGEILLQSQFDGIGEQQFVIQSNSNDFEKIILVNVDNYNIQVADQHSVHSHNHSYKNPKDCYEITGFKERDNNDLWRVEPIDEEMQKRINFQPVLREIQPRIFKYIHHQDRVVIRNYEVGGTLHSHNEFYKHGNKSQEVTWRSSIRRDVNDWWTIILNENSQVTNTIPNKAIIGLLHIGTKTRLTHIKDSRVKNKDYFEICSGQPSFNEFQLEGLEMGIPELNSLISEYPFRIKHLPTGQYLATINRPSSKSTFQGEMCLSPHRNGNTIWMIEIVDSIFE